MELTWCQKKHSSLQHQLDLAILVIILTLLRLLTTGSMKIECIINIKRIFEELKFIYLMLLFMLDLLILLGSMLLVLLVDYMVGLDMIEILIWRLIFLNYHLQKFYKLSGMVLQFLFEDWQLKKFIKKIINTQQKQF